MNKLFFFLIILSGSLLYAQIPDTLQTENYENKKGLLFDFNNLSLDTFQGGIGFKYWTSNQMAYTAKIKLSVSRKEKEKSEQLMGEESGEILIGVDFGIEKHLEFMDRISPYWGGTCGAAFEKINNKVKLGESTDFFRYPSYYNNETKTSLISFAVQFNLGVEFFVHKNISFAGHYSLAAFYKFGDEKIVSNTVKDNRQITELNTGISSSSLILSIYF